TQTVTTTLKAKISPKETIKPAPKEPQVTVSSKKIDTLASKEPKVDLNPKQPTDQSKSLGTIETELDAIFN
ncbi:hypothetical protein, partial [Pedobacter sp.]|uniref:hypothetical protein n=1 Tax=Pedobacter sp. TaxID=1411316 RepID=UPI003D7F557D